MHVSREYGFYERPNGEAILNNKSQVDPPERGFSVPFYMEIPGYHFEALR